MATKSKKACPICKNCGNRKFSIIQNLEPDVVVLKCNRCFMKMEI